MTDTIATWQTEHRNFGTLLDLLEEQLDVLHAGADPNYELMLDIMFYMTHYPDLLHHPREDVALEIVRRRQPDTEPLVKELTRQHEFIRKCGEELVADIDLVVNGSILSRDQVEAPGRNYVEYFRKHMASEEKDVLPLFARLLHTSDWSSINATVVHQNDPLSGGSEEARFASLRNEIAKLSGHPPRP